MTHISFRYKPIKCNHRPQGNVTSRNRRGDVTLLGYIESLGSVYMDRLRWRQINKEV